jgi:RsiW-degrading membrane proteinase PrsW (M82 family)
VAANTGPARRTNLARETASEVRELLPLFMQPLRKLGEAAPETWRNIIIIAAAGAIPLAITVLGNDELMQYWAYAFYFSIVWAVFFYYIFRPEKFHPWVAFGSYFFTALISMTLLMGTLGMGLEQLRDPLINSTNAIVNLPASAVLIGIPEELTKALALFAIVKMMKLPPLRTFLLYGLISGLGFGIYEGVNYQTGSNLSVAQQGDVGGYYIENVLRLTAAPFFHAIWTGIAAYFIWFGAQFANRRAGLYVLAICIPAILHGLYDGFLSLQMGTFTVLVAIISTALLCLYLGAADSIEQRLSALAVPAAPAEPAGAQVTS